MKYILLFLLALALLPAAHAQMGINSPAGVTPRQDMEIYTRNGFLVQRKYSFTTADPSASINTLSCVGPPPSLTAQAGILKDIGNDGDYPASQTCTQIVDVSGLVAGYEVVFEDLDTELNGDRVMIIGQGSSPLAFSGSVLPTPFFVAGEYFSVRFESNSNGTVGRGFRFRWRAVFLDNSSLTTPATAFGNALQFDAGKGALMSGFLLTGAVQRAGEYSTALGDRNTASGRASTALGQFNTASGNYSTALGSLNKASGDYSTALCYQNTASGLYSTALGSFNTASGDLSTALGYRVSTNGQRGSFMIGDSDPLRYGTTLVGFPDQFVARFFNGYYLMTSGDNNRTGVVIGAGQNAWGSISDSTRKERLLPINQSDLLRKIGAMKLTTWNYKGQREIRHYGPMAQDFYAAFGHDGLGQVGCDTLIYSHDFAGVTFAGVQALINENEQLKRELAQTKIQTDARFEQNAVRFEQAQAELLAVKTEFAARLRMLESVLFNRRDRVSLRKRP